MLNVYDHGKMEERNGKRDEWFMVDSDSMFPATVEYILENLKHGKKHDGALGNYLEMCKELDARAWELSLLPPNQAEVHEREKRALGLELARLVFTELLSQSASGPIQMYFPPAPYWRLQADVQVNIVSLGVSGVPEPKEEPKVLFELFGFKLVK